MKTTTLCAAFAVTFALPAPALEIGFGGDADLFFDRLVFGLEMTGGHEDETIVPEGYEVAESSPFSGQPVFFADGTSRLGTVTRVYEAATGETFLVIVLAEEVVVPTADAIYVSLPADARSDGSMTLNMTEEQLRGMAANWAD